MSETERRRTREAIRASLREKLHALYGADRGEALLADLLALADRGTSPGSGGPLALSERDALIIAYGDHVRRAGEAPLRTLHRTLNAIAGPVRGLHILPFFPWTSDDGFSVVDYVQVDPALGAWDDIRAIAADFRLMVDAVFNHVSAESAWFQGFLRGEEPYTDYFIAVDPAADLSAVTRPRTTPLLTAFETARGTRHVWTTFSADQIDVNAASPDLMRELMRALLFYVDQGAQLIRLDAIGFLWKRVGTTCLHLPETHRVIQAMRDVLDLAAPRTLLVTETNVPHRENISYFGDGANEAQMVYQFPLPPLVLHTLRTGDATRLSAWARTIERVSDRTTFFNFTASHDGIGLRPVLGILHDDEMAALVDLTLAHGGYVSYKNNEDGSQSPYELNITYFDAVTHPDVTAARPDEAVARFMVSQAIMLALVGIPGIYLHNLVGSRNDRAGVEATGRNRSINREKLDADALLAELGDEASLRALVHRAYLRLLGARTAEPAFHPLGGQAVLDAGPRVFAVERTSPDGAAHVLALHNIAGVPADAALARVGATRDWVDLLDADRVYTPRDGKLALRLAPYQVAWLKAR